MAKKITGYIKLQVKAGKANPSPPIGPALGQRGVNIMEFCKAVQCFRRSEVREVGTPLPTVITVYRRPQRSTFVTKTPPASRSCIKKAANLKSGSKEPGKVSTRERSSARSWPKSPRRR